MTEQFELPYYDEEYEAVIGDNEISGMMLVSFDESGYTHGDERFISEVRGAEILGFHIGNNVMLTRDQIVQLTSKRYVDDLECEYIERREG